MHLNADIIDSILIFFSHFLNGCMHEKKSFKIPSHDVFFVVAVMLVGAMKSFARFFLTLPFSCY